MSKKRGIGVNRLVLVLGLVAPSVIAIGAVSAADPPYTGCAVDRCGGDDSPQKPVVPDAVSGPNHSETDACEPVSWEPALRTTVDLALFEASMSSIDPTATKKCPCGDGSCPVGWKCWGCVCTFGGRALCFCTGGLPRPNVYSFASPRAPAPHLAIARDDDEPPHD
jgi:hypothetical protein